jgi:Sec-independent protein secretion pathway component TatC
MSPQPYRLPVQPPDNDAAEGRMGFLEHLDELRTRIIRSCIAIGLGMAVAFAFYDRLAESLIQRIGDGNL